MQHAIDILMCLEPHLLLFFPYSTMLGQPFDLDRGVRPTVIGVGLDSVATVYSEFGSF